MEKGCKVMDLLTFISQKRILLILKIIGEGNNCFSEIKKGLDNVNSKILSLRLTQLQEKGFIDRVIINDKPVKIKYILTEKGESFVSQIGVLETWIREWEK